MPIPGRNRVDPGRNRVDKIPGRNRVDPGRIRVGPGRNRVDAKSGRNRVDPGRKRVDSFEASEDDYFIVEEQRLKNNPLNSDKHAFALCSSSSPIMATTEKKRLLSMAIKKAVIPENL